MHAGAMTEGDTCREDVTPKPAEAGKSASPHAIGEHPEANPRLLPATLERVFCRFFKKHRAEAEQEPLAARRPGILPAPQSFRPPACLPLLAPHGRRRVPLPP